MSLFQIVPQQLVSETYINTIRRRFYTAATFAKLRLIATIVCVFISGIVAKKRFEITSSFLSVSKTLLAVF